MVHFLTDFKNVTSSKVAHEALKVSFLHGKNVKSVPAVESKFILSVRERLKRKEITLYLQMRHVTDNP